MEKKNKPKRIKRVVTYAPEDQYRIFRSILALQGKTVSDWFRKKMQEEIDQYNDHH